MEVPAVLKNVTSNPANRRCVDCGSPDFEWVSLGFGTFLCLNCAGYHRGLGVHITSVRSIKLDSWTNEQIKRVEAGGNQHFMEHLKIVELEAGSEDKYTNPRVLYYREILSSKIELRDPSDYDPEEWTKIANTTGSSFKSSDGSIACNKNSPIGSPEMATMGNYCNRSTNISPKNVPISPNQPVWTADSTSDVCMVCKTPFSLFLRRHHCRRCGRLVCAACAPKDNSRPIIEWGLKEAVRHCRLCYRSPIINWKVDIDASSEASSRPVTPVPVSPQTVTESKTNITISS